MRAARRAHRRLARQLGAAIGPERRGGRIFRARSVARAVEDVIGRDMDERHALFGRRAGHCAGGVGIDGKGLGLGGFGRVDGGPCGGVDDAAGIAVPKGARAGGGIGQIGPVAAKILRIGRKALQFTRDLPRCAENQQRHFATPSRSPTPCRA